MITFTLEMESINKCFEDLIGIQAKPPQCGESVQFLSDNKIFQRKIVPISFNICFGCSKELSH